MGTVLACGTIRTGVSNMASKHEPVTLQEQGVQVPGITVSFRKEKDTKNTVKYEEVPEKGKPPIMGTLYLQKWVAGDAQNVSVTLVLS